MRPWHGIAAVLLFALAGCGAASAQGAAPRVEHGVLEWIRYRSTGEDQERYSWITAKEEIQRDTATAFFAAVGVEASQTHTAADRIAVLDHLSAQGWEVVNRTDVAYADAGGSAIAERYLVRRRR
jgi:hypothetical protein